MTIMTTMRSKDQPMRQHKDQARPRATPLRAWNAVAATVDAATPASRDRAIDGLRALAILGVVAGHWLVMALTTGADGTLRSTSPLLDLPALAPASWVLQMLGLFFLVGGYSSAKSLARARSRGTSDGAWVRDRLVRLVRPVAVVTAVLGAALPLLAAAGVPGEPLRITAVRVIQPLWFIGVYMLVTALTPVAVALERKLGVWSVLPGVLAVAAVDLARYGVWPDAAPSWLGLVSVLPAWSFGYLLGISWAEGRLSRRGAAWLAAGGGALLLVLVLWFGYPASMVGVPGAERVNSHPPSLMVPALAAAQSGLAVLFAGRLAAFLRRPRWWAAVALANLAAMTIFCWHQVATMALSGVLLPLAPDGVPGLHTTPDTLAWVAQRVAWFPVYLVVLAGMVAATRRFEAPWKYVPGKYVPTLTRATVGVLAAAFGAYVFVVL